MSYKGQRVLQLRDQRKIIQLREDQVKRWREQNRNDKRQHQEAAGNCWIGYSFEGKYRLDNGKNNQRLERTFEGVRSCRCKPNAVNHAGSFSSPGRGALQSIVPVQQVAQDLLC